MTFMKRLFVAFLILAFAAVGVAHSAQAALVTTEEVARSVAEVNGESPHARLMEMFDRAEVQAELEKQGVEPAQAKERVAALTDEEASHMLEQIEQAPAGGIIGAILLVFFVLLVTDLLGLTKVYPFTNPQR